MLRICFHGRGGHGVKTASRIVSTAAFLAGFQCQDFPIYGAERRGAAVAAFTRISSDPILERGFIADPSIIILADETLLDDPAAGVLSGQENASVLFLNTASASVVSSHHRFLPQVVSFDVTGLTLQVLGKASALSAGLGAAASRLTGIVKEEHLVQAAAEEFSHLGIASDVLEKNIQICREVFRSLPEVPTLTKSLQTSAKVVPVTGEDVNRATPSVFNTGNADLRHTGSWRVERPVIDRNACTRCGMCFVVCPDGSIALDEHGYPVIDYDHCKGCMICRSVCPRHIITKERETLAW
ncbi:MAG: hypothetical protein A3F68_10840 [Acidobacteria bacterium RIFCSPLOWO2_12_FULL_54_10]|nr:MAG: hypothetical protein A3F68_10840 [Acidobacteria bacterium RIFCSPLOWO2_12_FULL_54_10]